MNYNGCCTDQDVKLCTITDFTMCCQYLLCTYFFLLCNMFNLPYFSPSLQHTHAAQSVNDLSYPSLTLLLCVCVCVCVHSCVHARYVCNHWQLVLRSPPHFWSNIVELKESQWIIKEEDLLIFCYSITFIEIWGSHCSDQADYCLLGCDTM